MRATHNHDARIYSAGTTICRCGFFVYFFERVLIKISERKDEGKLYQFMLK